MDRQPLIVWIDKASALCKSDAALARRIGVALHHPHEWRTGKRTLSPESAAMLAEVLGLDGDEARQLVALAVIEAPKNADRAAQLRRVLFALWAVGVAACPQQAQSDEATSSGSEPAEHLTVYTLWRLFQAIARALGMKGRPAPATATRPAMP